MMADGILETLLQDPTNQYALALLGGNGNFAQRSIQGLGMIQQQDELKQKKALQQPF